MFPSRPSPRNGLPTSPRSRSIGRSMQEDSSSSYSSSRSEAGSSRTVRSQRSVNSISGRDRSEPPPMPSRYNNSSPLVSHRESDASSSSTVSTTASYFMDKLRAGYESPRTSLEDDFEPPKRGRRQESSQENRSSYQDDYPDAGPVAPGAGSSLWGKIASAAGTLGVDVSKAWATNVAVYAGEETPPGQESRLTRAMKAYHLEKARDPTDLPAWLFEPHERLPVGRSRFATHPNNLRNDNYEDERDSSPGPPRSRGLRDIYDSAAVPSTTTRPMASDRPASSHDEPSGASKATNRLRAMRDAKRQNSRLDDGPPAKPSRDNGDGDMGNGRRDGRGTDSSVRNRVPPRQGLPSGPGGRTPKKF